MSKLWLWFQQLWCALDDHGGIHLLGQSRGRCKRCGAEVKLIGAECDHFWVYQGIPSGNPADDALYRCDKCGAEKETYP